MQLQTGLVSVAPREKEIALHITRAVSHTDMRSISRTISTITVTFIGLYTIWSNFLGAPASWFKQGYVKRSLIPSPNVIF